MRTLSIITNLILALGFVFGTSLVAHAQFVPLTNDLPSIIGDQTSLTDFLNGLFLLSIAVSAILAVIMIAIGGFQYMGSESYSSKASAKDRIRSALIGLGLVLGSYLILFTINPEITNLDILRGAPGGGEQAGANGGAGAQNRTQITGTENQCPAGSSPEIVSETSVSGVYIIDCVFQ